MRKTLFAILSVLLSFHLSAHAGFLDRVMQETGFSSRNVPDTKTTISSLKQALSIGTKNAVRSISRKNGYYGNAQIKIPVPKKMKRVAKALSKIGYEKEVNDFVRSMNRAAEQAAPQAKSIFLDAIKDMSFKDAGTILRGGDSAATDYLRSRTYSDLTAAFKPIVSKRMNAAGVTRTYKNVMDKSKSIRFIKKRTVDLDQYVTEKALDGLFIMIGQEEKQIRTDPAARVTELLRTVFRT